MKIAEVYKLKHKTGYKAKIEVRVQEIKREDMVLLPDKDFNSRHVCIVTGAASRFGRATAIVAATNKLMTIGLEQTWRKARRRSIWHERWEVR
jgi:hypothetical protein